MSTRQSKNDVYPEWCTSGHLHKELCWWTLLIQIKRNGLKQYWAPLEPQLYLPVKERLQRPDQKERNQKELVRQRSPQRKFFVLCPVNVLNQTGKSTLC
jgi:hypothetical protein